MSTCTVGSFYDVMPSFAIATGGKPTLFIAAPPNGSSVWVQVVDEVFGAIFEQEITADLPAVTQFLSPRLYLNTGPTAAAVAPLFMNGRGDRNCVLAGRSAVISCSNAAPDTSSTTRTQTELPFGAAAMNRVSTPPVAMAKLGLTS